jgi:hypothetical protein
MIKSITPLGEVYLYNLFLFHHLMEREKDHALIRSIDYGILLIGGKKEKNND